MTALWRLPMKIKIEYNEDERAEAIDAICVSSYQVFVDEFEGRLRQERKHGDHTDKAAMLIDNLWDAWHEMKADLPRGRM